MVLLLLLICVGSFPSAQGDELQSVVSNPSLDSPMADVDGRANELLSDEDTCVSHARLEAAHTEVVALTAANRDLQQLIEFEIQAKEEAMLAFEEVAALIDKDSSMVAETGEEKLVGALAAARLEWQKELEAAVSAAVQEKDAELAEMREAAVEAERRLRESEEGHRAAQLEALGELARCYCHDDEDGDFGNHSASMKLIFIAMLFVRVCVITLLAGSVQQVADLQERASTAQQQLTRCSSLLEAAAADFKQYQAKARAAMEVSDVSASNSAVQLLTPDCVRVCVSVSTVFSLTSADTERMYFHVVTSLLCSHLFRQWMQVT
jgi:hypothetical protein